jgi:TolB protein
VTVLAVTGCVSVDQSRVKQPPTRAEYRLAFASFAPLNTDLFLARADGSGATVLAPNVALETDASFSPDGRSVLFSSTRGGSSDLYLVGLDGTGVTQLTHDPAFDAQGAFSPDGRSVAFVSNRSGQADIWVLELATGAVRNLTNHAGGDFRPAWSPDGKWVAFSSDRDSTKPRMAFVTLHTAELFVMRADGSELRQVTHGGGFAGSPSFSRDGLRLLYYQASLDNVQKITSARHLRGTTQIRSVVLATGHEEDLTSGEGEKWSPQELADDRVAYASGGPEGGVEFTTGPAGVRGEVRNPRWSPDGRSMVFQRDTEHHWPPLTSCAPASSRRRHPAAIDWR